MAQTQPAYSPKYIDDDGTCPHWERDDQFMIDFPDVADRYLADIETDGKICAHCLWYAADMAGRAVCDFTEPEEEE